MPVRGLLEFLNERGLVRKESIRSFAQHRVGVDGYWWLQKKASVNEPLQVAMGGLPLTLTRVVREQLAVLHDAEIRPLFVFSGLSLPRKELPFSHNNPLPKRRLAAWEHYVTGSQEKAVQAWNSLSHFVPVEFLSAIIEFFRERNVEFFRAPYHSWAQLAYFFRVGMISAVYGGLECLLFGALRVIIDIDPRAGTCDVVDLSDVLTSLQMSYEQFVNSCLLAGFDLISTFPPLADKKQQFSFLDPATLVRQYNSGFAVIQAHFSYPGVPAYYDTFIRTRTIVVHHPVLDVYCQCEPMEKEAAPDDLIDIIGPKLPNLTFYFLSQSFVSSQVINNLVSGLLVEGPPLVESEEYLRVLDDLVDLRSKTLSILSSSLPEYFHHKRVVTIRWFESSRGIELAHRNYFPEVGTWLSTFLDIQRKATSFFQHNDVPAGIPALLLLCSTDSVGSTGGPYEAKTEDTTLVGIFGVALLMRSYIDSSLNLTVYGKTLLRFAQDTEHVTDLLILLDLIRMDYVSGKRASTSLNFHTKDQENERKIFLITRVVSLLKMKTKEIPWEGPISYDLMAFGCIVRASLRSWRNLFEMIMLATALRGASGLDATLFGKVATRLPLSEESSTAMGVVMKAFLEGASIEDLETTFSACADVKGDLKMAMKVWDILVLMIEDLEEAGEIPSTLHEEFTASHEWFLSKRKAIE